MAVLELSVSFGLGRSEEGDVDAVEEGGEPEVLFKGAVAFESAAAAVDFFLVL